MSIYVRIIYTCDVLQTDRVFSRSVFNERHVTSKNLPFRRHAAPEWNRPSCAKDLKLFFFTFSLGKIIFPSRLTGPIRNTYIVIKIYKPISACNVTAPVANRWNSNTIIIHPRPKSTVLKNIAC